MMPKELIEQFERANGIFASNDSTTTELIDVSRTLLESAGQWLENCCRHPACSRNVEEAFQYLYQFGIYPPLRSALQTLSADIVELSMHPNGSHCVQTLMVLCARRAREETGFDMVYKEILEKMTDTSALKMLLDSQHATQVLKALLRVEAGHTPEDAGKNRRHAFYGLMCDGIFGSKDPLRGKPSDFFPVFMKKLFKRIEEITFVEAARFADTSSLVAQYVQLAEAMEPRYSPLAVVLQLIGKKEMVDDLHLRLSEIAQKGFVDDSIVNDLFALLNEKSPLKQFSDFPSSQFLWEALLAHPSLGSVALAFLRMLRETYAQEKLLEPPVQFLYQTCVGNSYRHVATFIPELQRIEQCLPQIFALDQQQITSNAISASKRLESLLRTPKYAAAPEQQQLGAFHTQFKQLLQAIIDITESKEMCCRRLLFPQLNDTDPLRFDSRFSQNQKYEFNALQKQVDKSKESEEAFKELMTQKREEHEKLAILRQEMKYGALRRNVKTQNGFWAVGKELLVQIFQLTNDEYLAPFVLSFSKAFLEEIDKPQQQIVQDLLACLDHPAGCDVFCAFVQNGFIPLHYKLRITLLLKDSFEQLTMTRLGRQFVLALAQQLKARLQLASPAYGLGAAPVDVNLDAMKIIAQELAFPRRLKQLQRSPEGTEIIRVLSLGQFGSTRDIWEKDLKKHLERLQKQAQKKRDPQ